MCEAKQKEKDKFTKKVTKWNGVCVCERERERGLSENENLAKKN